MPVIVRTICLAVVLVLMFAYIILAILIDLSRRDD